MTEFIKAADLKKRYNVKGRFYILKCKDKLTKCRSLLTITDTTSIINKKKLLVIMLNPGSSLPLDKEYVEPEILTTKIDQLNNVSLIDAMPDSTQYQIMRVMNELEFSNADIINLYDIREPKSGLLFDIAKKGKLQFEASIFSEARHSELSSYFTADTTVILAWGNAKPIRDIEEKAIAKVLTLSNKINSVRGKDNLICQPSPLNHTLKLNWLHSIYGQLRDN
jgi:hypothetical protein